MAKDAFWFKHDSNASRDLRLLEIKTIYGYEGLGLFWAIIEVLREQDGYMWAFDKINVLAGLLSISESRLDNLISDCKRNGLLKHTENNLYSERLLYDMKVWESKKNNGSKTTGNKTPRRKHTEIIPKAYHERREEKKREDKTIEERIVIFTDKVNSFTQYPKEMLDKFCSYWTEHNQGAAKMRYEMEKVFDISRRLTTWSNNNFGTKTESGDHRPKSKVL